MGIQADERGLQLCDSCEDIGMCGDGQVMFLIEEVILEHIPSAQSQNTALEAHGLCLEINRSFVPFLVVCWSDGRYLLKLLDGDGTPFPRNNTLHFPGHHAIIDFGPSHQRLHLTHCAAMHHRALPLRRI